MVRYGVQTVPTIMVFNGSNEKVATFVGLPDRDELESAMKKAL